MFTDLNYVEIFYPVKFVIMFPLFVYWAVSEIRDKIKTRRRIQELEEIMKKKHH